MTNTRPCLCGKPVADGFLCWSCTHQLRDWLAELPWLLTELGLVLSKQTRFVTSSPKVATSSAPALVIDTTASDLLDRLRATLRGWDATIADQLGTEVRHPNPHAAAGFLLGTLDAIRLHPDVASLFFDLQDQRTTGFRVIDRPADRIYLGDCGATGHDEEADVDWRCDAVLWGRAGELVTTCPVCHTEHDTEYRQTQIRERAVAGLDDRLMPARQAAETLIAYQLVDHTITAPALEDRIRKWAAAGRLIARLNLPPRPGQRSRPAYRFGDVYAVHQDIETRRTNRRTA